MRTKINNSLRLTVVLMRILLLSLLFGLMFVLTGTTRAQDTTWTVVALPFTDGVLTDLYFVDKDTGWAMGFGYVEGISQAIILHTTNQGDDWIVQPSGFRGPLGGVFFVDANTGYAVGKNFDNNSKIIILKTTNGGGQWQPQTVPDIGGEFFGVHFVNATTGWAVGKDWDANETLIAHTADGATWVKSNHPTRNGTLYSVFFTDESSGWAVGKDNVNNTAIILHSSDGGQTWEEQTHPVTKGGLVEVFFVNAETGWAVGGTGSEGIILKTTDGGATWTTLSPPPQTTVATAVSFISPLIGFILTDSTNGGTESATLYQTTDGGNTWTQTLNTLADTYLSSMQMVEGSLWVYAVGSGAKLYKALLSLLARIDLTPSSASLQVGQQQAFQATGKDNAGNTVSIPNPQWSVSGGGTLSTTTDTTTTFTATQVGDYTITCRDSGTTIADSASIQISPPVAVDDRDASFPPKRFSLSQNYPNPFNPVTTIAFGVKESSYVKLTIYDLRGREVTTLVDAFYQPGFYTVDFEGRGLTTGVYLYQIQMRDFQSVRKMVLLR